LKPAAPPPLIPPPLRLPESAAQPVFWRAPAGDALALVLAEAAHAHAGPMLVVAPDAATAQRLLAALRFFLGNEAEGGLPVVELPDPETLPYDLFSPHQELISTRLATLYALPALERGVVVAAAPTLMYRLPPPTFIQQRALWLKAGQRLEPMAFRERLARAGYEAVSQVMAPGEFAQRGGLLDLFPMGAAQPFRLEWFDDELDSIRPFDPETQRSEGQVAEVRLLPAREFPLDDAGITQFRRAWRAAFGPETERALAFREVSAGRAPAGVETWLPLFFERETGTTSAATSLATLFAYLPQPTLAVLLPGLEEAAAGLWQEASERYRQRAYDRERPILPPEQLFLDPAALSTGLQSLRRIELVAADDPALPQARRFPAAPPPALPGRGSGEPPWPAVKAWFATQSARVLLLAEGSGRRESWREALNAEGLVPVLVQDWAEFRRGDASLALGVGPLDDGLVWESPALVVLTENQLASGERVRQRRRKRVAGFEPGAIIENLTELADGAPVVHEDYGVGRYRGLTPLEINGLTQEFLLLEYAGGDKLYVPVSSLHLVSRYTGADAEHAPWHRLGSDQWERAKRRAREQVYDVAAELLDIHARRAATPGTPLTPAEQEMRAFAEAFPFEETPDQNSAIEAVLTDLARPVPMDRVVCGDVGFGKTEVAMRAAFAAVQAGFQVAVLVPTTLLAQQHERNFRDRMAEWPLRIGGLSRFNAGKETERVLAQLAEGGIDIVVGTHKLLDPSVRFKNLGLVIVDEEHRFGVRHKEQLKALRAQVHLLTLTATPIPRTLNMALSGLRDLSIIATPPVERLAVKTLVNTWDNGLIREAMLRELKRGGQCYFIHNEVKSIEKMQRQLSEMVPEARIEIAHGQMPERELERVMADFYHQRFNVLLATTIVESGIDVPTANTILINRADRFGLAQLHQLRGRVGRSHHRAYAYLIIPPEESLTADAEKRLDAISKLEALGAGFALASHDLEIRGAGELLGESQSGQIHEIGFTLYSELLERAVKALKSGKRPELAVPLFHGTEIDLKAPALLPDDYVPDIHTRLVLYKRISAAGDAEALRELKVELIDRFGLLPQPAQNLFELTALKHLATPYALKKIDGSEAGLRLKFLPDPPLDPAAVLALMQREKARLAFAGPDTLRWSENLPDFFSRVVALQRLLALLKPALRSEEVA